MAGRDVTVGKVTFNNPYPALRIRLSADRPQKANHCEKDEAENHRR